MRCAFAEYIALKIKSNPGKNDLIDEMITYPGIKCFIMKHLFLWRYWRKVKDKLEAAANRFEAFKRSIITEVLEKKTRDMKKLVC